MAAMAASTAAAVTSEAADRPHLPLVDPRVLRRWCNMARSLAPAGPAAADLVPDVAFSHGMTVSPTPPLRGAQQPPNRYGSIGRVPCGRGCGPRAAGADRGQPAVRYP